MFGIRPLAISVVFLAALTGGFCQDPPGKAANEIGAPPKHPELIIRSVSITGLVFQSSQKEGGQEMPAEHARIALVQTNHIIQTTNTDKSGSFTLNKYKVGEYALEVGSLRVPLIVEPPSNSVKELPKVMIFVLPRDMVTRGAAPDQ